MWNIFKNKYNQLSQSRDTYEEDAQKRYRELKLSFEQNLKQLTKNIANSEHFFTNKYLVNSKEQSLARTFQEMMATLEGLVAIILQLKTEYDESQQIVKQYKQVKPMIANHHNIINSIQQSHSNQVSQIYEQKKLSQVLLNQTIKQLNSQNAQHEQTIQSLHLKIQESLIQNKMLQSDNERLKIQNQQLLSQLHQIELKYYNLTNEAKKIENKKTINFQHIKLEYLFYYGKLRDHIISFLQVKDIFNLERVNRFFRTSLHREQSRHIYQNLRRRYKKAVENEVKTAKFYQKIYQTFPMENIKICAFKYLYFKIRPAAYILPYLQQQNQFQTLKTDQESKNTKQQANKFNWKQFFTSDKNNKGEKKEQNQNKFSLSQFKNEQQYRRVEVKIQNLFKNIFPIKMPEDFKYFTQTMQKQLQQLKEVIGQYKSSKGPMEWTAQLHCLTKYMYLQINELYNLLQVVFGQLITKSKDLIATRQGYDYLRENEIVLRNLIENISNDKSSIQRKYIIMQNQILKKKLQNQAIWNKYHQIQRDYEHYREKHQEIAIQYADAKKLLQKFQDQRKTFQLNMSKIREEVEQLEKNPGRQRRLSVGSVNSEQQGLGNEANLF